MVKHVKPPSLAPLSDAQPLWLLGSGADVAAVGTVGHKLLRCTLILANRSMFPELDKIHVVQVKSTKSVDRSMQNPNSWFVLVGP